MISRIIFLFVVGCPSLFSILLVSVFSWVLSCSYSFRYSLLSIYCCILSRLFELTLICPYLSVSTGICWEFVCLCYILMPPVLRVYQSQNVFFFFYFYIHFLNYSVWIFGNISNYIGIYNNPSTLQQSVKVVLNLFHVGFQIIYY